MRGTELLHEVFARIAEGLVRVARAARGGRASGGGVGDDGSAAFENFEFVGCGGGV